MINLNKNSQNLVNDILLADKYIKNNTSQKSHSKKQSSAIAFAYEKARNAVEYRDEHLIRQAAIERILKRRLFLNQQSDKIASLLIKELTWARYIDANSINQVNKDKFKNIIEKYRDFENLVGLCACEIDEVINFKPIDQIVINYVSATLNNIIELDEPDHQTKSIQIYIATERSFAKNNEVLIKYKLLKVLLPNWNDKLKLQTTLSKIDKYLDYKYKNELRRKVAQLSPPFNIIRDLIEVELSNIDGLLKDEDKLTSKINNLLESKYNETKSKVIRASQRSIIYIFLTKMMLAMIIEIPFDLLLGNINYLVLAINILFPPSLMILFNLGIRLPEGNNTELISERVHDYFFKDESKIDKVYVANNKENSLLNKIFLYIFMSTSALIILGIIYLLNLLHFNLINQIIFLFFLSVVSFFAYRVREISNDYTLPESERDSFFSSLLDYIFLPIIKIGQWLSSQISRINILSFIFDFIIEAPLKTFLEIFEQWLHFVRVKKDEFLG